MSEYTTQVRYICESFVSEPQKKTINEITVECQPFIFDDFNLYSPEHKVELLSKFLQHYYMREIGLETVGLWKFFVNRKIREILPYYNELYKQLDQDFNILKPYVVSEISRRVDNNDSGTRSGASSNKNEATALKGEIENSETGSTTGTAKNNESNKIDETGGSQNAYSDTPQGVLNNVLSNKYLTDFRKIDDKKTSKSNRENESKTDTKQVSTSVEKYKDRVNETNQNDWAYTVSESYNDTNMKYIKDISGKLSNQSIGELFNDFKEKMINIDMLFIGEFKTLFMEVY